MNTNDNPNDRLGRQLSAILALADGKAYTTLELAEILGTTRRNVYNFLNTLRENGFLVIKDRYRYTIHPLSPAFQHLTSVVNFTSSEAVYLHGLLEAARGDSAMAGLLQRKLERFYDLRYLHAVGFQQHIYQVRQQLEQAMKHKQVVILHDYASSNSQTVTDRVVEPFLYLGDKTDVRAYEVKTGVNKTFKLSRIGSVEVLDTPWFNEESHRKVYTDMFMFSGEETHRVRLRFDLVSRNLMLEEYPHSSQYITPEGENHWMFETDLVKYEGIARFILGLFEHIDILEDDGLRQYIGAAIDRYADKARAQQLPL
jgi:predicted DNA-binding transcriptional regulator YafY